jgi:hypothetical protein
MIVTAAIKSRDQANWFYEKMMYEMWNTGDEFFSF